jgi:hypothetical protein
MRRVRVKVGQLLAAGCTLSKSPAPIMTGMEISPHLAVTVTFKNKDCHAVVQFDDSHCTAFADFQDDPAGNSSQTFFENLLDSQGVSFDSDLNPTTD